MSFYALKPRFQALLRPVAGGLFRCGITANQVTIGTGIVSVVLGLSLARNIEHTGLFLLLPLWMFMRMALNAIDGMLAREFGQRSSLGAYLNEIADVVADAALTLPFALLPGANAGMVALVMFLATVAEMAGALGPLVGAQRRHDGPMGKSDRAVVYGALALVVGVGVVPGPWLDWALGLVAVLLGATIANRIRHGVEAAGQSPEN